jgi:hypothetical protein
MKYFCDMDGETTEVIAPFGMPNATFAESFPSVTGIRYDSFRMMVAYDDVNRRVLPVTRRVNYKKNPSKHVCDSRCINAKGRTMNCECSCGGKNHGVGHVH